MTKLQACKNVACNLLLELTEDGNDMTWEEIQKEVNKLIKLEIKTDKIKKNFDKKFIIFD